MSAKGTGTKVLDVKVLEKVVFNCNRFIIETKESATDIQAQIRALKDAGIDKLAGGQGDYITATLNDAEKSTNHIIKSIEAISRSLNEKLGKTLDAYKDKNGLSDTSEKTKAAAANMGLKKQ